MGLKTSKGVRHMYAQKTVIHAPLGRMADLRQIIAQKYLPVVRARPGFVAAYLFEQVDDPEACELIQFWDTQAALENFHRTGMLQASLQSIAVDLPGVRLERQGYVIRVAVGQVPSPASAARA
jgi:quinol monooxygenase YgiN